MLLAKTLWFFFIVFCTLYTEVNGFYSTLHESVFSPPPLLILSLLFLLVLLPACDPGNPFRASDDGQRGHVLRPDLVQLLAQSTAQPSSPNFDPTLDYVSSQILISRSVTQTLSQPFVHPITGVPSYQHTFTTPPIDFFMEAGFDFNGDFLYNQVRLYASTEDPLTHYVDPTLSVQYSGGNFTVFDEDGVVDTPLFLPLSTLGIDAFVGFGSLFVYPESGGGGNSAQVTTQSQEVSQMRETPRAIPALQNQTERHERLGNNRVQVILEGDMDIAPSPQGRGQATQARTKVTRMYARQRGQLLIERITSEIEQAGGVKAKSEVRFSQVRIQVHEGNEAERRARAANAPPSSTGRQLEGPGEDCNPDFVIDPADCGPSGGSPPIDNCPSVSGGANVLFVHGFKSSADTWGNPNPWNFSPGVRPHLRCMVQMEHDDALTLPWQGLASHSTQTSALSAYIESKQRNQFILVGHSQGGLISRRVAQAYTNNANEAMVRGVISVGTPHQGARMASNLGLLRYEFENWNTCIISAPPCSFLDNVVTTVGQALLNSTEQVPAVNDLKFFSSSLQHINNEPEPFDRISISHAVPKYLSLFNFIGGSKGVKTGIIIMGAFAAAAVVAHLSQCHSCAINLLYTVYNILRMDTIWEIVTAGGAPSDAFIPVSSQTWPTTGGNLHRRFTVEARKENRESHMRQTRTIGSAREIRDAMRDYLNVQIRQTP